MTIDPPGPLYLPITRQRNITCSIENGQLTKLVIMFSDKMPASYIPAAGVQVAAGIIITSASLQKF